MKIFKGKNENAYLKLPSSTKERIIKQAIEGANAEQLQVVEK